MNENAEESAAANEERDVESKKNDRIQQSVNSMKKLMNVTEEEKKYRTDNFTNNKLKEYSKYFKCTKCGVSFQNKINRGKSISSHPLLDVLMCDSCCNYYGDGDFSLDSEGEDKYCRWCGEGGTLFSCFRCICAFCTKCIKKHFSENGLKEVENDDEWTCYFCNPKPLWYLRSICSLAKETSEAKKLEIGKDVANCNKFSLRKKTLKTYCDDKDDNSSESHDSSTDYHSKSNRRNRGGTKRISHRRGHSSESEGTNDKIIGRRKRRRNKDSDYSTETEKRNSNNKLSKSISNSFPTSKCDEVLVDETKSAKQNEKFILDKLKGIWKIVQIINEIGLKWSSERLDILSKPEFKQNLESLNEEYKKVKSVILMLASSISKTCDTLETLNKDLSSKSVKDDNHIFQMEEFNLKKMAEKLEEELKDQMYQDGGTDNEQADKKNISEVNLVQEKESEVELNKVVEIKKPILKVKDFAKMINDNVLQKAEINIDSNVDEKKDKESKNSEKTKKSQIDEYDVDTEVSSEPETVESQKNNSKSLKNASGSESKRSENSTARVKKNQAQLIDKFDKYREKRKRYMAGASQKENSPDDSREKGALQQESDVVESSDSDDDSDIDSAAKKSGQKQKKKGKKIFYSDEDLKSKSKSECSENSNEKSDSDNGSSSSDGKSKRKGKYKRIARRERNDEDSDSEVDVVNKGKNKKRGRKNIKKILKKGSLKITTREALKNEEERRKRVDEKNEILKKILQEKYGENCENSGERPEGAKIKELILDFDVETKEPLVTVHEKLVGVLKPHQAEGVKFMWDNCFESVKRSEEDIGSGCILAHYMGLGKTLQIIALVHTIMTHNLGVNSVLIICPLSVVCNWIHEFESWLADVDTEPIVLYDLLKCTKPNERSYQLKDWHDNGGVLVISYDLFRNLSRGYGKQKSKNFTEPLLDPGPDLVVCDEGHVLKNEDTAMSRCVNNIKTSRRIILTGTPLQNNLMEYHCMVQFVKPNLLGTKKEFSNRFVNPITNGQFEDSTEHDVKIMKKRSHVLHSLLKGCVQRCDYSVLTPYLPEKQEYVLSISLTQAQAKAYRYFIENLSMRMTKNSKTASLFNDYHNLQRIWTHPSVLIMHKEKEAQRNFDSRQNRFLVDSEEETTPSESDSDSEVGVTKVVINKKRLRSSGGQPSPPGENKEVEEGEEEDESNDWWRAYFKESDYEDINASNKLIVLFFLLNCCEEVGDKMLVFSQSLYSLDLIEKFLNKIDDHSFSEENSQGLEKFKNTWVLGLDYFRLDGSTSGELRSSWCKNFNKKSNKRARLFLISTRAGGLGINLFAANRVVVFDASWNPSHDLQSIFRVYRFGQSKTCYVYRFLAEATMEEKIYERQVTKLSLAHRVVDEHQIERHYSMMNLQELYAFAPTPLETRKTPKLPKDEVLARVLATLKNEIIGYHEHDSLLENREEEELTEEERKAAWQEFEDEKNRVPAMDVMEFVNQFNADVPHSTVETEKTLLMSQQLNIPVNILQRGFSVGLLPYYGESAEGYTERILNRELFMGKGQRET